MEFKSFTSFPPTHRKDDWRGNCPSETLASGTLRNTAMHRQCNERAKQSCDYARWSAASSAIRSSSRRAGSWLLQSLMRSFLTAAHVSSQAVNFPC